MKFNIILLTAITLSIHTVMVASDKIQSDSQQRSYDTLAQEISPAICESMINLGFPQEKLNELLSDLFKGQFVPSPYLPARSAAIALICLGADASLRTTYDRSLLHFAAHENDVSFAQFLLDRGASVDAITEDQDTPLHLNMADPGSTEMASLLIERGADVEAKGYRNFTPLTLLADNCSMHVEYPSIVSKAELLLVNGAELNHRVYSPLGVHCETAAELAHRKYTRDGASSCKDLADFLKSWEEQPKRIQE